MKTMKNLLWLSAFLLCLASCSKDMAEEIVEIPDGKVPVLTEITVDGVVADTRASSAAGYTTGDGLYDKGDKVIVSAVANDGYELLRFYEKTGLADYQGKSSYNFDAEIPLTFKAEFAKKYTITVSADPTSGGSVTGGGTYTGGTTCTLTATANPGYTFSGWYEGSTRVSSNASYSFTVSSDRTITGKFVQSIVYYFRSSDTSLGTVDKDYIMLEDYQDVEYGDEFRVQPTPRDNAQFVRWFYIRPDGYQDNVLSYNIGKDNLLFIENSQYLETYYPAGTEFVAVFKSNETSGGDKEKYTVTFNIAERINNNWVISQPLPYCLSWTPIVGSLNETTTLTKQFKKGETCTIYWAGAGGDYEAMAISDPNYNILKYVTGKDSYSFTVTQNVTYYVVMAEIR